jgi:Flp pilus assembly protein TadG
VIRTQVLHEVSMIACSPRRTQGRRPAAAAAEFALMLPILSTLLLGMFEISRAIIVKEALSNAVQRAARIASLPGKTNTHVTAAVQDILSANNLTGYTTTIKVNDVVANVSTAKRNDKVSVQVSITAGQVFWVSTFFVKSTTVESEAVVMLRQG